MRTSFASREKTVLTEHKASQVMARKDHRLMGMGTETC